MWCLVPAFRRSEVSFSIASDRYQNEIMSSNGDVDFLVHAGSNAR